VRGTLSLSGLVGSHERHVEGAGELARMQNVRGPFYWVGGLIGLRREKLGAQARGAELVGGDFSRDGDGAGFAARVGGGGEVFLAG
jgi:hypothetical protein